MPNDSSIKSISQVEQYGKNIKAVNDQMEQLFEKLGKQTEEIGSVWNDSQYEQFRQDFRQDIMVKIKEVSAKMLTFSDYTKRICELHRQVQSLKR